MADTNTQLQSPQPFTLPLIAASAIVGGTVIGASTNAINGAISPAYFRNIMHGDNVQDIWRASIAQGIFEGLLYGILFAVAFTSVVSVVSRGRCSFRFAFRYLVAMIVAIYCCWAIGGLIAMGLATLSPDFYRHTFIGVPDAFGEMLRYAWVGGSIWGALFGCVLSAVIGSAVFAMHWHRSQAEPAA